MSHLSHRPFSIFTPNVTTWQKPVSASLGSSVHLKANWSGQSSCRGRGIEMWGLRGCLAAKPSPTSLGSPPSAEVDGPAHLVIPCWASMIFESRSPDARAILCEPTIVLQSDKQVFFNKFICYPLTHWLFFSDLHSLGLRCSRFLFLNVSILPWQGNGGVRRVFLLWVATPARSQRTAWPAHQVSAHFFTSFRCDFLEHSVTLETSWCK